MSLTDTIQSIDEQKSFMTDLAVYLRELYDLAEDAVYLAGPSDSPSVIIRKDALDFPGPSKEIYEFIAQDMLAFAQENYVSSITDYSESEGAKAQLFLDGKVVYTGVGGCPEEVCLGLSDVPF